MPPRTEPSEGPIPPRETGEAADTAAGTAARASRRRSLRFAATWLVFTVLTALAFSLAYVAPDPGDDHAAGERALATAQRLEDHGHRYVGTPRLAAAMDDVQRALTAIPGLEVTRQRASGTSHLPGRDVVYSVTNVIARVPGKSSQTVLVNTHVDAPLESVGASDDAVNVGAAIEAARTLSRDHEPEHTVVFLFNGGEEVGFTGADAFTRHRWARQVAWYLNLEAVGAGGLPVLFQASENSGDLVAAAGAAARPFGSAVGQQLFQTGLLNSDTDSRVWRRVGWEGLDYALIEDGYVYHTPLDRVERIPAGTAQSVVDTVVDVVSDVDHPRPAPAPYYFDLLQRAWLTVDPVVPVVGSGVVFAALAGLVLRESRRSRVRAGAVVLAAGLTVTGLLTGVVAGVAVGGLSWLTQGSFAWYGHPWLIGLLYLPAAGAGALVPLALLVRSRRRARTSRREAVLTVALGVTAATAVLSVLTAWTGLGAAYLLWSFSALLVAALWLSTTVARRWAAWPVVAATAVQGLLTAEFVRNLYTLLVPLLGREPSAVPPDVVLGALTGVIAFPLAVMTAVFAVHAGRLRRVSTAFAAVLVVGLVTAAVLPPYTAERPKHLILMQMQEQQDGPARILLESDGPQSATSLGLVREASEATDLRVRGDALLTTPVDLPSGTTRFRRPDGRELSIDVGANRAARVRITLTGPVLSVNGRSFDGEEEVTVDVVARPEGFRTQVRTAGPVTAVVEQTFKTTGPDAARVAASMPEWTVVGVRTVVVDRFEG